MLWLEPARGELHCRDGSMSCGEPGLGVQPANLIAEIDRCREGGRGARPCGQTTLQRLLASQAVVVGVVTVVVACCISNSIRNRNNSSRSVVVVAVFVVGRLSDSC